MKRVFLIVLDSFGIGALPDANEYGDEHTNTLYSCSLSEYFDLKQLKKMGLFEIDGVRVDPSKADDYQTGEPYIGSVARMTEASKGKDTTIGHWEISGIISTSPLPTYPNGFPADVLDAFSKVVGRNVICNLPYSGTQVIQDYGDEHCKTGDLIVYTSADSVFQIAAHEEIVPLEELYRYCKIAREVLQGEHGVGRVIARPFVGSSGQYERTTHRHDFSLEPPQRTMLDILKEHGKKVIGVGKINDIFVGRGIDEYVYTSGNKEGIDKTFYYLEQNFNGLCFINLVDYDMLYGHRNDIDGYAKALTAFDQQLGNLVSQLKEDDLLMITADHGCDPGYKESTDHSREYTPLILYYKGMEPKNYHTRDSFCDIAATILQYLEIPEQDITISGTAIF